MVALLMQVSHVGANLCFVLDALTYMVAALCAYRLKVNHQHALSVISFSMHFVAHDCANIHTIFCTH